MEVKHVGTNTTGTVRYQEAVLEIDGKDIKIHKETISDIYGYDEVNIAIDEDDVEKLNDEETEDLNDWLYDHGEIWEKK